jgi:hypothetical protein
MDKMNILLPVLARAVKTIDGIASTLLVWKSSGWNSAMVGSSLLGGESRMRNTADESYEDEKHTSPTSKLSEVKNASPIRLSPRWISLTILSVIYLDHASLQLLMMRQTTRLVKPWTLRTTLRYR